MLALHLFPVGVGPFTEEMSGVASLRPSLRDLAADAPGRSPPLVRERERFLARKLLGDFENFPRQDSRLVVNDQLLEAPSKRQPVLTRIGSTFHNESNPNRLAEH